MLCLVLLFSTTVISTVFSTCALPPASSPVPGAPFAISMATFIALPFETRFREADAPLRGEPAFLGLVPALSYGATAAHEHIGHSAGSCLIAGQYSRPKKMIWRCKSFHDSSGKSAFRSASVCSTHEPLVSPHLRVEVAPVTCDVHPCVSPASERRRVVPKSPHSSSLSPTSGPGDGCEYPPETQAPRTPVT